MTDRKLTCAACKSAITKGDIAGSDLEFGGELKATNQPEYTADADTDLVATVGTLDEYTPMVRTTGNQTKSGVMTYIDPIYGRIINPLYEEYSGNLPTGKYRAIARITADKPNTMLVLDVMASSNGSNYGLGRLIVGNPTTSSWFCKWVFRKSAGWLNADVIQIAKETETGDLLIFAKNPTITGLCVNLVYNKVGGSIHGDLRVTKITEYTDYALDGSDTGIEGIVAGSDFS